MTIIESHEPLQLEDYESIASDKYQFPLAQ